MSKLVVVKPTSTAQKATRTTVDTVLISKDIVSSWKNPPFQRPLRVNDKVRALAETIKADGGVLPGVVTLGVMGGAKYLLDGQHRREAFLLSGCDEGYTDVRTHFFDDMGQMGEEFVALNSQLVRLRPDDILRGLEGSFEPLRLIRAKCRFVGYDMIRRNENAPILSMSLVLRVWRGSASEVPAPHGVATTAANLAKTITEDDADQMIAFLLCCHEAWGRELENARLWGSLNLILCAWLYRRTVITQWSAKTPKLTRELFRKCLMSLSADAHYTDWLVGRHLGERDRSPAYDRLKAVFAARLALEMGQKPKLPAPAWAHGK